MPCLVLKSEVVEACTLQVVFTATFPAFLVAVWNGVILLKRELVRITIHLDGMNIDKFDIYCHCVIQSSFL